MVHGAALAQSLMREGLLDELEIHLIPVVLGAGRRLFDENRIELELTRVLDAPDVTHLRYRVASPAPTLRDVDRPSTQFDVRAT